MKSDKAKLIVEAGGAIAVLLGLVFVGLELRQNTEAVEAATVPGTNRCIEQLYSQYRVGPRAE